MCDEHRIEMRRMLRLLTNIISYIQFTSYSIRIWFWKVARRSIHINHFNIVFSTFETLSFYFEHLFDRILEIKLFPTVYNRYLNSDHSFHLSVSLEFVCLTIIMRACVFILLFTYIAVNLTFSSNEITTEKKVSGMPILLSISFCE